MYGGVYGGYVPCLNPCSNGMKIEFVQRLITARMLLCLNPCSNGMKIEYIDIKIDARGSQVLILVLME